MEELAIKAKSSVPTMGRVVASVVVTPDLALLTRAYEGWLSLEIAAAQALAGDTAAALGLPQLADAPAALLANQHGRSWLLAVEQPAAPSRSALSTWGWMAQEILVSDVDGLAAGLQDSPFSLLRPPADLDVSDAIRACQVQGPAGEILYLTQVSGAVPPFELPTSSAPVDHLFIPVLSTPDRQASLKLYADLAGREGMSFDTRISVVNQALGLPLDTRHPVATLQLADNTLIEIDQIEGAGPPPEGICAGTACIVFMASGAAPQEAHRQEDGFFADLALLPMSGAAGERFVLAYSATL